MAKGRRPNLFWPSVRAFLTLWMPRIPGIRTRQFWIWTAGTYAIAFSSLAVGIYVWGGWSRTDVSSIAIAAIMVTVPAQFIGAIVHAWGGIRKGKAPPLGTEKTGGFPVVRK